MHMRRSVTDNAFVYNEKMHMGGLRNNNRNDHI
jgi:hypothetical protein